MSGSGKQVRPTTKRGQLVLISILGAAVVLTVLVIMTPLEEFEDQTRLADRDKAASQLPDDSQKLSTDPGKSREIAEPRPQRLQFPTEPEQIEIGRVQDTLRDLAERLQQDYPRESGAFHFAAQTYFELNQTEKAEKAWRQSIALPTPAAGPFAGLAKLLINAGQEQEALDVLDKAAQAGVESEEITELLAEAYENQGELEKAQGVLTRGLKQYPENGNLWLAQGRILNQLGEYAPAEESLLKALELKGESESVLFLLSTAQVRQGKTELAAANREKIRELRREMGQVGSAFQENYESALRTLASEIFLSAASLEETHSQFEVAESLIWQALELIPTNAQAYMALSSVLRQQGRLADALQVHQQLIKIQPDNLFNYTNLASIALQTGAVELARNTLLEAAEKDPDGVVAQALLAKLYLAEQQFAEATRYANIVLKRNRSVESYLLLASVYEAQGELEAAQQLVAQARSMDPRHPVWNSAQ